MPYYMNSSLPADKPASLHLLQERLLLRLSPTRWPKPECTEGEQCMICHALAAFSAWEENGAATVSVDAFGGIVPDHFDRSPESARDARREALAFDLGVEGWLVLAVHAAGSSCRVAPEVEWRFDQPTLTYVRWYPGTPYNTAAGSISLGDDRAFESDFAVPSSVWNPLNGQEAPLPDAAEFRHWLMTCGAHLTPAQTPLPAV
jgi:hypothetical protein